MRQILIIIAIALIGCQTEKTETSVDFKTTVFNLDSPKDSISFADWQETHLSNQTSQKIDTLLFSQDTIAVGELYYSDDQFLVYGYCQGEFGGALMFQARESKDSIYYLECTCPVMIDKRDDGYYITESLAHIDGFGKVQCLKYPKELVNVHIDSLRTEWKVKKYPDLTEHEIWKKLENQGTVLIDTIGLTFSMFFPYDNENYLIFSDYQNTYLGLLTTNSLKTVDTLLNLPTWTYNDALNDKINGYYHYNFRRRSDYSNDKIIQKTVSSGDIFAKGDSIVIAYRFNETTENK
ncbi:MAG: hypothetical protein IPL35_10050 [Sphingobacteriales bacterium]|nr:hypothetical protein [Sphingobacteriales bacterium]